MSGGRIVVYLLGQDLRTADNPILHYLSITGSEHGYTHLLPVYVLPPDQIDLSGLVKDGETFPYPHALTGVGRYWKCGIHRVRFLVESVWDLKSKLEALGSGLIIRAGSFPDVLEGIVQHYADQQDGPQVAAVWMTKGFLPVEVSEQQAIASFCDEVGLRFVSFRDHKWFIDNPELSTRSILELPDKFSEFQTRIGRMEYQPRRALPPPLSFSLPPYPDHASLPTQKHPFDIPDTLPKLFEVLSKQVGLSAAFFKEIGSRSLPAAFPAKGGETQALNRLRYAIKKGIVSQYHTTIDDLKEQDGCFNLSAYLSLGCISARQVHEELVRLEQGTEPDFAQALGFGKGENMGTKALRAEMLHIDFIRLCNRKYGQSVYSPEGSGLGRNPGIYYKTPNRNKARPDQVPCPLDIEGILVQFQVGATGFGLIDAIMRQLLCTGYISIRSQMLAANFLGKFAGVDWRYGVEWVASLSIEHDASLHWHRWQHYVGIGPDPSGGEVTFSPAHAALEFDPDGHFVREWMPELRRLTALPNLFRVATTPPELLQLLGLATSVMVTRPVPSDAVNCQRSNHRSCGGLHPQLFVSRPPHGFVTLGPYPRFLPVSRSRVIIPIQAPSLCSCPPPPPEPPRLPLVFLYLPRPRSCGGSPEYLVVPQALPFSIFQQTLAWSLQISFAAWMDSHHKATRNMVEMAPLQDAEASSHPGLDREPLLPARASPLAPGNALSGPIIANSASGARHDAARGPTAMRATSRGPTIVVSDPRAVAAAAALRETHSRPDTMAPPPSGPRAERAAEAPQATPRMQHVAPMLQHHGTAQPPPGFFQEYRGSSQAPLNAPRGPRADYRPPAAQSNAPPNAPRGPRADYWPSQPPRNAPQAPRGQPWQYHTHQDGSQAHRSQNWQYQQRRNVVPGNISTSQTTQNAFNALPTASRASQAMQPFPPAPQWSPQMPESFAGATHPTTYPYSLYTSPPCPALYGPYAFNRPSTYQYMEELPYYQVLQDYNQWHASGPSGGGPWNATPPDTDEVVRHGMILRFLDSLPPPPSNPEFPPDPPQLYLKTRRRRGNQSRSSRESGDTGQTESTEGTTTITRPVMPTASVDVLPPPVAQRTPYRRGRRGTSGRRRQADDNNRDGSGQGSEQSDKPGASDQAVDVADAAKVIESADVGDIDETHENGQDDGEGEECDGQEDDVDDDCASAASCMW